LFKILNKEEREKIIELFKDNDVEHMEVLVAEKEETDQSTYQVDIDLLQKPYLPEDYEIAREYTLRFSSDKFPVSILLLPKDSQNLKFREAMFNLVLQCK